MKISQLVLLMVCLVFVGCAPPTIYRVAMSPDGEGVRRELTVENGDELDAMLRGLYTDMSDTADALPGYAGVFEALPGDVGGSGSWLKMASPMGRVYGYAERFRGDDDLVGQVEARLLATDRMTDLLIAWYQTELGGEPTWQTLRGFMDTQMRHDMKNMSLYLLEVERAGLEDERWIAEYVARAGQYLIDRGYWEANDLTTLIGVFDSNGDGPDDLLVRVTAARMGLGEGAAIPGSLGFLKWKDGEISDSWSGFLASQACAEIVAGWGELGAQEELAPGDTEGAVMLTFLSAAGTEFEIFSSPDEVHVTMACPSEPIATNGVWDADAGQVAWDGHVRERFGLPLFYYAFWGEADTAYQEAHLGEVLFQGERMAQIVMWYSGLTPEDQQRWDGFIESLDPAVSLQSQVEAARGEMEQEDTLDWGYTQLFNEAGAEAVTE